MSAACRSGLERRFYDGQDRKVNASSTSTQALLLRSYIRCFTIIIPAFGIWQATNSRSQKQNLESKATSKRVRIRHMYRAFVPKLFPS